MQLTLLVVDEHRYVLPEGTDVERVRSDLVGAVRSGGGFVHVEPAGHEPVEVLISPATSVSLSMRELDDEEDGSAAEREDWWDVDVVW